MAERGEVVVEDRTASEGTVEAPTGGQLARVQATIRQDPLKQRGSRRERESVARFLNMDVEDPALDGVMAIAKAYSLSPFLGELVVIDQKVKVRDAEGRKSDKWIKKPAATRDGFLSVAHKSGVYRGMQADVVHSLDTFDVDWSVPAEQAPRVVHRHAALRPGASLGEARNYRGPIIGAWAKVARSDQLPFFYFAPIQEHGKVWNSDDGRSGWSGAWSYTSAMIVKAAGSYALRMAFSITGVVPLDELRSDGSSIFGGDEGRRELPIAQFTDAEDAVPTEGDPVVLERLRAAVAAVNDIDPSAWPAAKCELVFGGRSMQELDRLAGDIEREAQARLEVRQRREGGAPATVPDEPAGQVEEPRTMEPEQLREELAAARLRAGAAQSEEEHAAAADEVEQLEQLLREMGEPGAIDPGM